MAAKPLKDWEEAFFVDSVLIFVRHHEVCEYVDGYVLLLVDLLRV